MLLAYAKLGLHDDLLESGLPDEPWLETELMRYFPQAVRERFPDAVRSHRLRREIIATQIANAVVNRGGSGVVARLAEETGAGPASIARAYILTRDAFGLLDLNNAIDRLDARIGGAVQLALYAQVKNTLLSRMIWFLRNGDVDKPLEEQVKRFAAGVEAVSRARSTLYSGYAERDRQADLAQWVSAGVPDDIAERVVDLRALEAAPEGVVIAERAGAEPPRAVATLFALTERLGLSPLKDAGAQVKAADRFERLAIDRANERVDLALRAMTIAALKAHGGGEDAALAWTSARDERVRSLGATLNELMDGGLSAAKLSVAASLVDDLARAAD